MRATALFRLLLAWLLLCSQAIAQTYSQPSVAAPGGRAASVTDPRIPTGNVGAANGAATYCSDVTLSCISVAPATGGIASTLAVLFGMKPMLAYWGVDFTGFTGTGATNATKMQTAIASLSNGTVLYLNHGTMHLDTTSGPIVISTSVVIRCDQTSIVIDNAAGDVFSVTAPDVSFEGCLFSSGTQRTSGKAIKVVSANGFKAITNEFTNQFQSIDVSCATAGASCSQSTLILNNTFRTSSPFACVITLSGAANAWVNKNTMAGGGNNGGSTAQPYPQPLCGLRVVYGNSIWITENDFTNVSAALDLYNNSGYELLSLYSANNLYDGSGGTISSSNTGTNGLPNVRIATVGAGSTIHQVSFDHDWFGNGYNDGLDIDSNTAGTTCSISGVAITQPKMANNRMTDFSNLGGCDVTLLGGTLTGLNPGRGQAYDGIYAVNTVRFSINGTRVGPVLPYATTNGTTPMSYAFSNVGIHFNTGNTFGAIMGVNTANSGQTATLGYTSGQVPVVANNQ